MSKNENEAFVRRFYDGIMFVGGGIMAAEAAGKAAKAGADTLVVGSLLQTRGFEKTLREMNPNLTERPCQSFSFLIPTKARHQSPFPVKR